MEVSVFLLTWALKCSLLLPGRHINLNQSRPWFFHKIKPAVNNWVDAVARMNVRCGVWPAAAAATQRSAVGLLQRCRRWCSSTGSFLEAGRHQCTVGVSYRRLSKEFVHFTDVFLSHFSSEHHPNVPSVCKHLTTLLTTRGSPTFAVLWVFY